MSIAPIKITKVTREGVTGEVPSRSWVRVENFSPSPYGPTQQDAMVRVVRADASGKFSCKVPKAKEGDVVRVACLDKKRQALSCDSWINIHLHGLADRDERPPEIDVQGLRLHQRADGKAEFENVRRNRRVGEPEVILHFTNQRTMDTIDIQLDGNGCIPENRTLDSQVGDTFVIAITDGVHNSDLKERWASLIVTDPNQPITDPPGVLKRARLEVDMFKWVPIEVFVSQTGPLIKGRINGEVPQQGAVGNCWMVSTISAVAHTHPEILERMLELLPNGNVAVTFKRFDHQQGRYVDHVEIVKPELPMGRRSGGYSYGKARGDGTAQTMELWWPLLEKAYAQWKGGYDAIEQGYPYAMFEACLGIEGEHIDFQNMTPRRVFAALDGAVADNAPTVVNTCLTDDSGELYDNGIKPNHSYTLWGTRTDETGKKFVTLREPADGLTPLGRGENGGIFEMTLGKFMKYFVNAGIGSTSTAC
ncbi:MAG: hypothetical protein A2289_21965 [Deltaproteobacteria bacterium RIFOXYA12_FULL_58_15]|nr:MAG: hypothetical protein A2289_21965 [Deltaproteobacteria bacterium RIFOXYA12_FULL_58_15]